MADIHHTKHYYAGTERLCCRIGGGGLQDLHEFQVPDSLVKEKENANHQMLKDDLACAGARVETKGLYFEVLNRFIENLSPEEGIYYYHPDHLGGASWITDAGGQPIQHLQYLPYGETLLDQRNGGYHERYTFSGKEKDSETGYYYFGARYYNPDLSLWLSVDPMSDQNPDISPYHYCHWNPMRIVDPDGRDDWEVDKLGYITRCKEQPENPTEDRIRVKGSDGWTDKNSLTGLSLGTLSEQEHFNLNGASGSLIALGGTADDRDALFKFCADNSEVEYSLMDFKIGETKLNYLTTSHDERRPNKVRFGDDFGSELAKSNALFLISHTHNHFGNGEYGWGASDPDYDFKQTIMVLQVKMQKEYPNHPLPHTSFQIYKCKGPKNNTLTY